MAKLSGLVKDTAIYGVSSMASRFLNYLLVPIQTAALAAAGGGYGVITNVYAYTALLLPILTFGMETTFLRYANKSGEDPSKVFASAIISVGSMCLAFVIVIFALIKPVSTSMGYGAHPSYVWAMALTVAIDSFQAIPFVYLRYKKRPVKFLALKVSFVVINVLFNFIYFIVLPWLYQRYPAAVGKIYDPTVGVGYTFYINLISTALITLFFYKELTGFKYVFDWKLIKRMLGYSWPMAVLGVAGVLSINVDKIIFPYIYKAGDARQQLGIYGAGTKIAMIMAVLTQAFRYAYEPFVFGTSKEKDSKQTYAKAMKYYVIFTLLAFLAVIGYIDILRYVIAPDYWDGLKVTAIIMASQIVMGVYLNLSFWYKLIDKTIWGAYFSGVGCLVIVAVNIIFVPIYGYMACAWAGLIGNGVAMLASYFVGQRKYPIDYPVARIMGYVALAVILYVGMALANKHFAPVWAVVTNTILLVIFAAYLVRRDFPSSRLPLIGRRFNKNEHLKQ